MDLNRATVDLTRSARKENLVVLLVVIIVLVLVIIIRSNYEQTIWSFHRHLGVEVNEHVRTDVIKKEIQNLAKGMQVKKRTNDVNARKTKHEENDQVNF